MRIALALMLNAALLGALLPWLWQQWQHSGRVLRRVLLPALALRLLVGGLSSVYMKKDADIMSRLGRDITVQLWTEPTAGVQTFFSSSFQFGTWDMQYYGPSNAFFFGKMLALLNLASASTPWINGVYISLFAFVGAWQLIRALGRIWPAVPPGAGIVALLFWPSVVVFGSGISKEAVLLGSGSWLVALVLKQLYGAREGKARGGSRRWVYAGILLLAAVHFKTRYFFAVPLLAALAGLTLIRLAQRQGLARRRVVQVGLLGLLFGGAALIGPELGPAFTTNKFTTELVKIYNRHLQASAGKPHFEYPQLRPSLESALKHAPLAVWNTLTRPWLGETKLLRYVAGGLENMLLLGLLALAGWAAWRGRAGNMPFALALVLGLYSLLLAFLIGISTPNLGSMHRYRACMLPFLLLLLLQNDYAARLLTRLGLGAGPAPTKEPAPDAVSLPN